MHKGRRVSISLNQIEESSYKWKKFGLIKPPELQDKRPIRALEQFVGIGIDKKWWSPKSLRNSETFKRIVILCYGRRFWEDLEKMRDKV